MFRGGLIGIAHGHVDDINILMAQIAPQISHNIKCIGRKAKHTGKFFHGELGGWKVGGRGEVSQQVSRLPRAVRRESLSCPFGALDSMRRWKIGTFFSLKMFSIYSRIFE